MERYKFTTFIDNLERLTREKWNSLYENQQEYLTELLAHLKAGNLQALGVMPTGSGKTRTYAFVVIAAVASGLRVGILAPTIDLTRQNAKKMGDVSESIIDHFVEIHSRKGGVRLDSEAAQKMLALSMTYSSFRDAIKAGNEPAEDLDILIFDEAHELFGEQLWAWVKQAINVLPDTMMIAATATPKKSESHDLNQVFGEPFYEMTTREGIERGMLPGAEAYVVNVDVDLGIGDPKEDGKPIQQNS